MNSVVEITVLLCHRVLSSIMLLVPCGAELLSIWLQLTVNPKFSYLRMDLFERLEAGVCVKVMPAPALEVRTSGGLRSGIACLVVDGTSSRRGWTRV